MSELPHDFWSEFDFSDGRLLYAETHLTECMLHAQYPYSGENAERPIFLSLIIGNGYDDNRGLFHIEILWDTVNRPVACYTCKTCEALKKLTYMALEQVHKELVDRRLSYYGKLWETITVDLEQ
ncbi:MAG: hypothetical protein K2N72_06120 [Oscillospiraceae bacterium]|nr:hypothetical protein [Oscillospiraceae bacterium]